MIAYDILHHTTTIHHQKSALSKMTSQAGDHLPPQTTSTSAAATAKDEADPFEQIDAALLGTPNPNPDLEETKLESVDGSEVAYLYNPLHPIFMILTNRHRRDDLFFFNTLSKQLFEAASSDDPDGVDTTYILKNDPNTVGYGKAEYSQFRIRLKEIAIPDIMCLNILHGDGGRHRVSHSQKNFCTLTTGTVDRKRGPLILAKHKVSGSE